MRALFTISGPSAIMKKSLLILSLALFLGNCSSPMQETYTSSEDFALFIIKHKNQIENKIGSKGLLTLGSYIITASLAQQEDSLLVGKSYQEILTTAQQAKKQKEEAQALAKEAARSKTAAAQKVLEVSLADKAFSPINIMQGLYESQIILGLTLKNTSTKDIQAFKGTLIFNDLLDDPILKLSYTFDKGLPAGSEFIDQHSISYNEFIKGQVKLQNKQLNQIKTSFEVDQILFSDGTKIQ